MDVADNISKFFTLILTCLFYAPIIPAAIPIALMGSVLSYLSFKYMLLRVHNMPEMFGDLMATFFASLMPVCILIWSIAYVVFVSEINNTYSDSFSKELMKEKLNSENLDDRQIPSTDTGALINKELSEEDSSGTWATTSLYIAIACIILPIRSCIHSVSKDVEEY